jgi:O-6-methylguanine DNA methyltransferase
MNPLLAEMLSRADPSQAEGLPRFFKTGPGQYGEGDRFLGIKVPVTRAVVRRLWRQTGFPELEECLASGWHEVRLAGLLALVETFSHAKDDPALRERCAAFYLAHAGAIDNWDLVDLSCYQLLGTWLLDKDRSLLRDLARHGKTLWEKRIAIVSTMAFLRRGQLDDTFEIAEILLSHPHDLIHKAVGWLLREAGKRDKAALEAFLAPRAGTMPRTMLRYAIERFPEAERQRWLAAGKAGKGSRPRRGNRPLPAGRPGGREAVFRSVYRTPAPFGDLVMESDGAVLTALFFAGSRGEAARAPGTGTEEPPVFRETRRWLDAYFSGRDPGFVPPFHLPGATPFREEVSREVRKIPFGATATYGEIAAVLAARHGVEKMSAQAVGGAVGWNPVCLVVPCHRVVGAAGALTGYGGGLANKIALLAHEGHDPATFSLPHKREGRVTSDERGGEAAAQ